MLELATVTEALEYHHHAQVTRLRLAPSVVLDNTEQPGSSVYQEITIECLRLRPDNLMVCQPHEGGTIERF